MITSPEQFRLARERLGYTQHEFGDLLQLGKFPDRTIRRWESGDARIPRSAAIVLEAMLSGYEPDR